MAIVLIITTQEGETTDFPVLSECTLGRSSKCDLSINDLQMSGKHGIFELNGKGELLYTDLDSSNGSFLNENQIHKIQFKTKDVLRLGNTKIVIDEKKLNAHELLVVGKGPADSKNNGITLSNTKTESRLKQEKEAKPVKIDINKHKKK